jgi:hypothetical protein
VFERVALLKGRFENRDRATALREETPPRMPRLPGGSAIETFTFPSLKLPDRGSGKEILEKLRKASLKVGL